MNLGAIRVRIAAILQGSGFNPYSSLPPSPDLPAAIVGFPEEITYTLTQGAGRCELFLAVRLLTSLADDIDAVSRLDRALSTDPDSVYVALQVKSEDDPWRQLVVRSANNFTPQVIDGGATALAADLNLWIITSK